MDLKKFLGMLRRRVWIALLPFAVVVLTAVVGSQLLPSFYEAKGRLIVGAAPAESSVISSVGIRETGGRGTRADTELADRVALAKVAPLLSEVVDKLQLRDGSGERYTPERVMELARLSGRASFEVRSVVSTDLVVVRARSRYPEQAAMMVNTLIDIYVEQRRQARQEEFRRAREYIEKQLEQVKNQYEKTLAEIRDFLVAEKTLDVALETQSEWSRIVDLVKAKEQLVGLQAETLAKLVAFRGQLGSNSVTASASAIMQNPQIATLKRSLAEAEAQREGLLAEKMPGHPDVEAMSRRIASLRQQLEVEVQTHSRTSQELESIERDAAGTEARIKDLDGQIAQHFAQLPAISQKNFTQSQLSLRYDVTRTLYNNLLQTLNSVSISEAMTLADIRLVEPAEVPDGARPAGPNRGLIGFMGGVLGMIAAVSLVILLEHLDDTIKTPDDAREAGGRLLGTIPRFRKGRGGALISIRDRQDPVSEAYRIVRNNLRFAGGSERPLRSLLVTSPLAGEGKTTTVANLGISVAWEGKRVLLVDSDLRRPALHRLFGLDNTLGLADVLTGKTGANEAIRATPVDGLFLMAAGTPASDPALLIESQDMRSLVGELSRLYDLVILDSPPALVAVDAVTLARYADGAILILESGRESPAVIAHAKDLCSRANVALLGIVLNKYRVSRGGYSYHYPPSYNRNKA